MTLTHLSALVFSAVLAGSLAAQEAGAKPGLANESEITDGIMAIGIANQVRRKCDDISARMVKAYFYLNRLENRARDLGYSKDEIDAFLSDKDEEAKIIERGLAFLKTKGVDENDIDTLCAFGRGEIQNASLIGSFLKAK